MNWYLNISQETPVIPKEIISAELVFVLLSLLLPYFTFAPVSFSQKAKIQLLEFFKNLYFL